MALQAIWAPSSKSKDFTHRLKRDLAGNSCNAIDFLVVVTAFVLTLSESVGYQKLCDQFFGGSDVPTDLGILPEWFMEHMALVQNVAPATSASSSTAASASADA